MSTHTGNKRHRADTRTSRSVIFRRLGLCSRSVPGQLDVLDAGTHAEVRGDAVDVAVFGLDAYDAVDCTKIVVELALLGCFHDEQIEPIPYDLVVEQVHCDVADRVVGKRHAHVQALVPIRARSGVVQLVVEFPFEHVWLHDDAGRAVMRAIALLFDEHFEVTGPVVPAQHLQDDGPQVRGGHGQS